MCNIGKQSSSLFPNHIWFSLLKDWTMLNQSLVITINIWQKLCFWTWSITFSKKHKKVYYWLCNTVLLLKCKINARISWCFAEQSKYCVGIQSLDLCNKVFGLNVLSYLWCTICVLVCIFCKYIKRILGYYFSMLCIVYK